MSLLGRARAVMRALFARRGQEREMDEEMGAHIAQAAERFMTRGMSENEAVQAARREFGNMDVMQEDARDARGGRWLETTISDLRHAAHHYARSPVLALTIVLRSRLLPWAGCQPRTASSAASRSGSRCQTPAPQSHLQSRLVIPG